MPPARGRCFPEDTPNRSAPEPLAPPPAPFWLVAAFPHVTPPDTTRGLGGDRTDGTNRRTGERCVIARMVELEDGPGPDEASDEDALVQAAQSDLPAFAPLYDRYHDAIFGYCLRRLGSRDTAGDATSRAFTRAMSALGRYRGGSFRAWLFAIAHNVVIDAARRRRFDDDIDTAAPIADRQPSPEDHAVASDQRRQLADALARLTADQRSVVELRVAGLTGPEVATALGLSIGAVKSLQFRAYARLRNLLREIDPTGDLQ